jgi:hypothetical protein
MTAGMIEEAAHRFVLLGDPHYPGAEIKVR